MTNPPTDSPDASKGDAFDPGYDQRDGERVITGVRDAQAAQGVGADEDGKVEAQLPPEEVERRADQLAQDASPGEASAEAAIEAG